MTTLNRRDFLSCLVLTAAGTAALPRVALADLARGTNCTKISDFGIVDLHCHPSLKMYLWGEQIWKQYLASAGPNPFTMQITTDELGSGYVKGMLCAHYLVEAAFTRESKFLKKVFPWIKRLGPRLVEKVEHEDASNFTQINIMLDELESQVHRANREQDCVRLVIARDFSEFEQAITDGCIPIAHAIEGAHALGRNFPLTSIDCQRPPDENPQTGSMHGDATKYLRNLEALKMRGVCLMTIGHILENDIAFPTEGIAPDAKKLVLDWKYDPLLCNRPLTPIGEAVVRKMLDIGMIVDLTHSTPAIRQQVFDINRDRKNSGKSMRPLTFTHVGSQAIFEKYDGAYHNHEYDTYKYYDANASEIEQICECNGVIGVIPENFWLLGCDTKLDAQYRNKFRNGIEYIVETICDINEKSSAKDFDNISIGTDFDGLADAPQDLYKPSQMGALIEALHRKNIADYQIKKITSLNALRLLKDGWTA